MCGIAGILQLNNHSVVLNSFIEEMTETLRHRGPDDAGFLMVDNDGTIEIAGNNSTASITWESNFQYTPRKEIGSLSQPSKLAFGHRRLSVIDVSAAGHQPMCNSTQDIWLVMNGEIYNYLELRHELESLGHRFITQSDTEVLLKAYEQWGRDCFQRFNGMWSFVIYDKKKNLLFGSRDRTGVKPFYYFLNNNYFCFASEPKALVKLPFVNTGINESAVFNHLVLGRVDVDGSTLFKNIVELPPATYFELDIPSHTFSINKYFQLEVNSKLGKYNKQEEEKLVSEIRELSFDAVEKRLRSDIPVGFCLSGGIDSSGIVCMAHEISKQKNIKSIGERLTAFTAINHFKHSDERHWAEKVIDKLNINWVKADCTSKDLLEKLPEIIYYQDSPLISTSTYAQYKVMEAAGNSKIQVLIDGQGGDELFAGYAPFYTSLYLDFLKNFKYGALFNEIKHARNSAYSFPIFAISSFKIFTENTFPEFLKPAWTRFIRPETPYFDKNFWNENSRHMTLAKDQGWQATNLLLEEYFSGYFLKNLLRWEDRCSMRFSIESRTPFSDDLALMERVFQIPSVYKIHDGWNKNLLRKALKGVLPDEIRLRTDKMGFSTPQNQWLIEINLQMKKMVQELSDSTHFVNKEKLLQNWEKIFSSNQPKLQSFAFYYLCYLIWQKEFSL